MFRSRKILFLGLLSILTNSQVFAQAIFGSIQGSVFDNTGAVVPRALVSARNVSTGVVINTETNNTGLYFLGELRPGSYELEVEGQGFQRFVQRGIALRVEDRLRVDVNLQLGQVTEAVEVTSDAPLLQTQNNTIRLV